MGARPKTNAAALRKHFIDETSRAERDEDMFGWTCHARMFAPNEKFLHPVMNGDLVR
jgi:hypothetical protein